MSIDQGWAIRRNGTCLSGFEVDCGRTVAPFRGCCPSGFECPSQYNIACCRSGSNCTQSLVEAPRPRCANATWDLFDNGGYFCCEHNLPGYDRRGSNGCALPGAKFSGGEVVLPRIREGEASESSSSSSSSLRTSSAATSTTVSLTSSTVSSSATSTNAGSTSGSSTPAGAIAGGVVGGIALLAIIAVICWLVMRRRKRNQAQGPYLLGNNEPKHQLGVAQAVHEVEGNNNSKVTYANELSAQQAPVELPGSQR